MATINPVGTWIAKGVHRAIWETITTSGDTLNDFVGANLPDKTIQVNGTFASAVVTIKGSNDGTTYDILLDADGNALQFTATTTSNAKLVRANPQRIKPTVSGATGGTDVDVILISYGSQ